jgi:glycogen synthase
LKVLYCTSEAAPFASTGRLAEVAGSLPKALRLRLIGCRVVLPLYEDIPQELRDEHEVRNESVCPCGMAQTVLRCVRDSCRTM